MAIAHRNISLPLTILFACSLQGPLLAFSSPPQAPEVSVTEEKSARKNTTKEKPFGNSAKGGGKCEYDVDIKVKGSKTNPAEDCIGLIVQYVDVAECIGYGCHTNSTTGAFQSDCETYTFFTLTECRKLSFTDQGIDPGTVGPDTDVATHRDDTWTPTAKGTGCVSTARSRLYFIAATHPRFDDINERLEESYDDGEKVDDGPEKVSTPMGDVEMSNDREDSPGGGGVSDSNGNGHEDLSEPGNGGHESTEDMVADDAPSSDNVGHMPLISSPIFNPPQPQPWAQYIYLAWDTCGRGMSTGLTGGVGAAVD